MYCNECGAQNPDTAKFCNNCGFKMVPVMRKEKPEFYSTLERLQNDPFGRKGENATVAEESVPAPETVSEYEEPISIAVEETSSVEDDPLARLSTFKAHTETKSEKKEASADINPIEDEYWNDTLSEIDAEINAIPKENILKIAGSIVALFVVIAWLIYML